MLQTYPPASYRLENGTQLLRDFIQAYFVQRQVEATVAYLTEDICWTGFSHEQYASGKQAVRRLLEQEMAQTPQPFLCNIEENQEEATGDGTRCVMACATLQRENGSMPGVLVRLTLVCRWENAGYRICAYHSSAAQEILQTAQPAMQPHMPALSVLEQLPGAFSVLYLCGEEEIQPYFFSQRLCAMLGSSPAGLKEYLQQNGLALLHPEDAPRIKEQFEQAKATGQGFEATYRVRKADGTYLWVSTDTALPLAPQSPGCYFFITYTNVTALKESEIRTRCQTEKLEIVMQNAPFRLWEYDILHRRCIQSGAAAQEYPIPAVMEQAPESVIEQGYVHSESAAAYLELHEAVCRGEATARADVQVLAPDCNTYEWHRLQYVTMFDEQGRPVRALGISEDITEQRKAEKRYHEQLAYRDVLDAQLLGSFRLNLTDNWCGEGRSVLQKVFALPDPCTADLFFARLADACKTQPQRDAVHAVFCRGALLERFEQGENELSREVQCVLEAGEIRWVKASLSLLRNPVTGHVEGLVYVTDIHDRRQMEQLIRGVVGSEFELLTQMDLSTGSYRTYRRDVGANSPTLVRCGADFYADLLENHLPDMLPEDVQPYLEHMQPTAVRTCLEENGEYELYYRTQPKNSEIRSKKMHAFYTNPEEGLVCFVHTDITTTVKNEHQKQQELEKALQEAQQASCAKSEFLSRISHEIRTPMNAILGLATLAELEVEDPCRVADSLSKINMSAQFMLSLLNEILDMSRIESGKLVLREAKIPFACFLQELSTMVHMQAEKKNLEFETRIVGEAAEVYYGDGIKLQQVLVNILSNAVKFTPEGGLIELEVRVLPAEDDTARLCFAVTDTGVGIDEAFLPHLFEPFAQEQTQDILQGTGLGLAISRNIVLLMGGTLTAQSTKGEGAVFTVEVPLRLSPSTLQAVAQAMPVQPFLRKATREYDFTGCRVLLAEDHPTNQEVARRLLLHRGFAVDTACNGRQAVELLRNAPQGYYDIVLMDIRMPEMDGLAAAKAMREWTGQEAAVPIVAMTANAFEDDMRHSYESGMDAHLPKPLDPAQMFETLAVLLHKNQEA